MGFYYYLNEEMQGPIGTEELMEKIRSGLIQLNDYVYPEEVGAWQFCFEQKAVQAWLKSQGDPPPPGPKGAPKKTPPLAAKTTSETPQGEWYIQKQGQQYGPFSYGELIQMVQNKEAFSFDMIWRAGQENWQRLAEVTEFKPEQIRGQVRAQLKQYFHPRTFSRASYSARVVAHNNAQVWKGAGIELGEGGAAISLPQATLLPGDTLLLHFGQVEDMASFNVRIEIVSKRYGGEIKSRNALTTYDVRFLDLNENVRKEVKTYVQRHVVNA